MLTLFLVWRWSGTKFNNSRFFVTALIFVLSDLYMLILYLLSTILYIVKQQKNCFSVDWNLGKYFLYIPTIFKNKIVNKLIVSGLQT